MLHRVTWFAALALAVVGVGTTVGYWGYNQKQQKDALALRTEAQYESAFHNLVNDVSAMRSELAKTMLTQDNHVFQSHLSDVSRMSYAAQADTARLPASLAPSYHLHAYLTQVETSARRWMKQGVSASDQQTKKQVNTFYQQAGTMVSELGDVQDQLSGHVDAWVNRRSAGAVLVTDGMKKVDSHVASFADSPMGASPTPSSHGQRELKQRPVVSANTAIQRVAVVANVGNPQGWTAKLYRANTPSAYYSVSGRQGSNQITAEVTQHGGTMLTYYSDRTIHTSKYDYVQAANDAKKWLSGRGYHKVELQDSSQYDHTATFTFAPTIDGIPVVSQPIQMHVALDNGEVTGFNSTTVIQHPVVSVAPRRYSESQLQKKLSPDFQVQMAKPVIILDETQQYVPAVAFFGTLKKDTFRVVLDARDASEIQAEQLP